MIYLRKMKPPKTAHNAGFGFKIESTIAEIQRMKYVEGQSMRVNFTLPLYKGAVVKCLFFWKDHLENVLCGSETVCAS